MDPKNQITRLIEDAAAVAAHSLGLAVWGVELAGGSGRPVARIFVDTPWQNLEPGSLTIDPENPSPNALPDVSSNADELAFPGDSPRGVAVDQCADISRMMGLALEVEDIFTTAWILEVSSPGLERAFFRPDQLPPYIGSPVEVTLLDAHPDFENRRKFRGTLKSVDGLKFTLLLETPADTLCVLDWSDVRKLRLVHIFPDTSLPKARSVKEEVKKA